MNKITGCIFDLDGVIVDTAKYHFLAWRALANELGFEFSEEDNEALKGISRQASLERLLQIGNVKIEENKKLELMDKKNIIYVEYISTLTKNDILPGVEDFLKLLKENHYKISLGSVSKNAVPILTSLNLMSYFDAIIDGTKISKGKPDPETGFIFDAKKLGALVTEKIIDKLDHHNLNMDVDFMQGKLCSIENLVVGIWNELESQLPATIKLHCLKLVETEKIYVEYYGDKMSNGQYS